MKNFIVRPTYHNGYPPVVITADTPINAAKEAHEYGIPYPVDVWTTTRYMQENKKVGSRLYIVRCEK